ncbi:hypothetical protein ACHAW5_006398 [Stephanodiscus triporus]|uniref:Uncharacterized protein n=1 Tax=Stephanodiscus triporus TaxID=2934178 RepID=A0ABD3QX06_9STRA
MTPSSSLYRSNRHPPSSSTTSERGVFETRIVVVGKIILDVYGDPAARDGGGGGDADGARVTIGGGGSQV